MRDGTTLTGIVTATSPAEITLAGDDHATHTVPMTQVKSIEYDEAPAAQSSATQTSDASSGAPATPTRRSAASRADDAAHEHHYHPTQAEIHTKTYVLPMGTKVPVRTEETIDSATAAEGQTYAAEIADDVFDANGDVVVPLWCKRSDRHSIGHEGKPLSWQPSDLVLDLQSISGWGKQYLVSTTDLQQKGKQGFGANKRTAEFTGGGAALAPLSARLQAAGKVRRSEPEPVQGRAP